MRKQKKLAIVGAGEAAKPYLDRAKVKNVYTICFGQYDNSLYRDECDRFVDISIFDVDGIINACRTLQIDGIVPSSEITTEIAATVAARLNLPGHSVAGGFAGRNKYVMRQRVASLQTVRQPQFSLLSDRVPFDLPVVVKSADSCGKRGITLVRNLTEWDEAVSYAREHSESGQVLIEEYVDGGQEYSVECLCYQGNHQIVQITEKDSSGPPHFIELGHHQPAVLSEEAVKKIEQAAHDILTVLGLGNGLAHLEIKLKEGEVYFIEVGARGAGGRIADTLIGLSTDFDYFGAAIDVALGQYTYTPARSVRNAGIYFLCQQTTALLPLFHTAANADWCKEFSLKNTDLQEIVIKSDDVLSGHFIYAGNRKITLEDAE